MLNWDLNSHPTSFELHTLLPGLNVTCACSLLKVVYKGILKLNGIGVKNSTNFCLRPCTKHAEITNDGS